MGNLKTVIIGSNGQLGTDLLRVFDETDIIAVTHQDLDITDADGVDAFMKETAPSAVVNTAAYHHTGKCEANPVNAFEVNAVGALNLARACERSKSLLVHVSTDYVFDGDKCTPYVETDPAVPLSVYGLSKLAGELAVMSYCPENYVLRTCGLYGLVPCRAKGDNFITKIRRLAAEKGEVTVVDDEIVTPTWTFSFARQIKRLCDERPAPFGLTHASDEGQCSWYEFTREIFELTSTKATLKRASVDDFPTELRRPRYSVLENAVLKSAGANIMEDWRESLARYLELAKS
jgi:dTDP-4-dehydrorhamnose reductase